MFDSSIPRVPLQRTQGCLLGTLPRELVPGTLDQFELDLLAKVRQSELTGVVIDLSALELMDLTEFRRLRQILSMTAMLGRRCIVVGLRPGVVAGLVALGADATGMRTALNVELGLETLLREAPRATASGDEAVALPEELRQALGRAR
jgi:rsbT antagonist protein RsbS